MSDMSSCDFATCCGLEKWFVHIIEKYGWMTLTMATLNDCSNVDKKHKIHKIKCYLSQLDSFCQHCNVRINQLNNTNPDCVELQDINIIHNKILIFREIVNVQLNTCKSKVLNQSDKQQDNIESWIRAILK
uniref:Uncharacterized protein n=1 Tax=viral metagenome TaxID=1070528 RepID=A0A6C0H804_9ZZZZ